MIVYKFRVDGVYVGAVELPDGPTIPPYHTWSTPPEKEGFHAVMRNGWMLVEGPTPSEPEPLPPPSPPEPDYAAIARAERNALLSATDWTQLADAPVDKDAWALYRQALRDIPLQETFPTDVQWPVQPE
jgi:hypothetical protein